jgi:hypothetical protein
VADDLIDGVEVVEGEKHEATDDEVDDGSSESNFSLIDEPDITGDAST